MTSEHGGILYACGERVKPVRQGTKRERLITLVGAGATIDELCEELGWTRSTVKGALYTDIKPLGYGLRRTGDQLRLLFPTGVTKPKITPRST